MWKGFQGIVTDVQAYTVNGQPAQASAPINAHASNTGLDTLPAARAPAFWYAYSGSDKFPNFAMGGRVACAGARYHYDKNQTAVTRLPPVFDGKWFIWDWRQRWMRAAALDAEGAITGFTDMFAAQIKAEQISRLTDLKVGPDGALYALQYGWVDYQPSSGGSLFRFDYKRAECQEKSGTALRPRSAASAFLPRARAGGWDVFDLRGRRVNTQGTPTF